MMSYHIIQYYCNVLQYSMLFCKSILQNIQYVFTIQSNSVLCTGSACSRFGAVKMVLASDFLRQIPLRCMCMKIVKTSNHNSTYIAIAILPSTPKNVQILQLFSSHLYYGLLVINIYNN